MKSHVKRAFLTFFCNGYADKTCTKPKAAKSTDKMYKWTWDNLKKLIKGER